jgi:hypothetical protein
MNTTSDNRPSEMKFSTKASEGSWHSDASPGWLEQLSSILLALLPAASFLVQYVLSLRAGTQQILLHHLTVTIVDWVFVPFNFFAVPVIDWRRGGRLYLIACISVVLNVLTHAFWQYNGLDPGHMITKTEVVLPAGWVHLAFSILEMVLLVAFVFCRKPGASRLGVVTALATIYFLTMGICGYIMHQGFIISDVIVFVGGLFFVLVYPRVVSVRLVQP